MNINNCEKNVPDEMNKNVIDKHIFRFILMFRVFPLYTLIIYALNINYKLDWRKFYSFADPKFNENLINSKRTINEKT